MTFHLLINVPWSTQPFIHPNRSRECYVIQRTWGLRTTILKILIKRDYKVFTAFCKWCSIQWFHLEMAYCIALPWKISLQIIHLTSCSKLEWSNNKWWGKSFLHKKYEIFSLKPFILVKLFQGLTILKEHLRLVLLISVTKCTRVLFKKFIIYLLIIYISQ